MKFIDTHAHLNFEAFKKDYSDVIEKSFQNEIEAIINIGSRFDNSKEALNIAEKFKGVYVAIGFHPDHLTEIENIQEEVKKFETLADNPKVAAIGEIGLDNYYFRTGINPDTKENRNKAQEIFKSFLSFACSVDLPVIIHSREADKETAAILTEYSKKLSKKGVVHCFTGSLKFAQKVIELGFYIGFTGIITYSKTDDLQKVVKKIPLDKILIETDAPFLAPQACRGQRNEPIYVKEIAKEIASIKNISFEEVANITTKNAKKLFNI